MDKLRHRLRQWGDAKETFDTKILWGCRTVFNLQGRWSELEIITVKVLASRKKGTG